MHWYPAFSIQFPFSFTMFPYTPQWICSHVFGHFVFPFSSVISRRTPLATRTKKSMKTKRRPTKHINLCNRWARKYLMCFAGVYMLLTSFACEFSSKTCLSLTWVTEISPIKTHMFLNFLNCCCSATFWVSALLIYEFFMPWACLLASPPP